MAWRIAPLSVLVALSITVAPAHADPTRAEYVAQVDPICQAFAGPLDNAWGAYIRNSKREARAAKSGTLKAWLTLVKRTARSLNRLAQIHTSLTDQIAPVPPPAVDARTVGTWINYLRQEASLERAAALALLQFKFGKYFHRLRQADKALLASQRASSALGFQVCGVSVV